jgi:ABC-type bacteriocin/lantibiotic exporter with double-glycine peptidase domain
MLGPFLSQYLIDKVVPSGSTYLLKNTLILFCAICLMRPIIGYFQSYIYTKLSQDITTSIKKNIYINILNEEINFFKVNSRGSIIARVLNDSEILGEFVSNIFLVAVKNIILVIFIFIGMFKVDIKITLYILLILTFFVLPYKYCIETIRQSSLKRQRSYDKICTNLNDTIVNIISIKIYKVQDFLSSRFTYILNENKHDTIKLRNLNNGLTQILEFLNIFCIMAIYWFGFTDLFSEKLTLGKVMSLSLYFQNLLSPVMSLLSCNINFQIIVPIIDRIREFNSEYNYKEIVTIDYKKSKMILVKNLSFAYMDECILDDFSCEFKQKTITCIYGKSGVGKSTLINLILGIINPQKGEIVLEGNFKNEIIAYVPQEITLFHLSIIENIKLGNNNIQDSLIYEICKKLNLYDEIQHFPDKFDTIISDQINISGGQAQRILIARALAVNPYAIIMDEPTSALDNKNKLDLIRILKDLSKAYMIILVTHDDQLIKCADNVIELK